MSNENLSGDLLISKRLREERKRFGLNQTEFGALAGTSQRSQTDYETGKVAPDSSYLAAIAAFGVDVMYILTGKRCGQATVVAAGEQVEEFKAYPEIGSVTILEALMIIEKWLTETHQFMDPDKKIASVKAVSLFLAQRARQRTQNQEARQTTRSDRNDPLQEISVFLKLAVSSR